MSDRPLKRYGQWAGNERGHPEDVTRCRESVRGREAWIAHQCHRKRGHGPNGDFCKQHAKGHAEEAA